MLLNIGNNLGKKLIIKNPNPIFIKGLLNHTDRNITSFFLLQYEKNARAPSVFTN